jgi:hypothetical protein
MKAFTALSGSDQAHRNRITFQILTQFCCLDVSLELKPSLIGYNRGRQVSVSRHFSACELFV